MFFCLFVVVFCVFLFFYFVFVFVLFCFSCILGRFTELSSSVFVSQSVFHYNFWKYWIEYMTAELEGLKMSLKVMNTCVPIYLFWPYIWLILQMLLWRRCPFSCTVICLWPIWHTSLKDLISVKYWDIAAGGDRYFMSSKFRNIITRHCTKPESSY